MANIDYRLTLLTKEERLKVIDDYNGHKLSIDEICTKWNIHRTTLYRILKKAEQEGGEIVGNEEDKEGK